MNGNVWIYRSDGTKLDHVSTITGIDSKRPILPADLNADGRLDLIMVKRTIGSHITDTGYDLYTSDGTNLAFSKSVMPGVDERTLQA